MVDCRNCNNSYKIWNEGDFGSEVKYKLVCLTREVFIDASNITSGPCDEYVDVDGYDPRE